MPKKKLPNIILIVLDTARAKNFSCYGYHRQTTPNIDRIAEEGVLYERCLTPANWTLPAHVSMLTGLYPSEHGCHAGSPLIDSSLPLLPELLKAAGYYTTCISCNGFVSPIFGFDRGFDEFHELFSVFPPEIRLKSKTRPGKAFELTRMLFTNEINLQRGLQAIFWVLHRMAGGSVLDNATPYTQKALALTRYFLLRKQKPLFLLVNLMQTHGRYNPPRQTRGLWSSSKTSAKKINVDGIDFYAYRRTVAPWQVDELRSLYDEELCFLDAEIGELYVWLKRHGFLAESVLILTADHGELIGEHQMFDHICGLYNELLWIPLIIRHPDNSAGNRVPHLVQLHDLFATILEFADLPYPAPQYSQSLLSAVTRSWALAQDIDAPMDLAAFRNRNPEYQANGFPWVAPAAALIDERTGIKLIETIEGYKEIYRLNANFLEGDRLNGEEPSEDVTKTQERFRLASAQTGFFEMANNVKNAPPEHVFDFLRF